MTTQSIQEVDRQQSQSRLDTGRSKAYRNELGQFATPITLANEILQSSVALLKARTKVKFLDPAFGTGAFYSALLSAVPRSRIEKSVGIEIDDDVVSEAKRIWAGEQLEVWGQDFTTLVPPTDAAARYNLMICNPPYVRHHHLASTDKIRLGALVSERLGISISGLAGLYCYFMLLSHEWLVEDGVACWLVPSEFLDVNYGSALRAYLLADVDLLRIHRFDPADVQFADALVSSAVVWFRKARPRQGASVAFTFGGNLDSPHHSENIERSTLAAARKWTRSVLGESASGREMSGKLGDYFTIKRGVATGANEFFILNEDLAKQLGIPKQFLRPILPSPRNLTVTHITADESGLPLIQGRRFLLNCSEPEELVSKEYPALWAYLKTGVESGVRDRYLCTRRTPWYSQEARSVAPLLCTYMGRAKANGASTFRFILNESEAIAANTYLMLYPKPPYAEALREHPQVMFKLWQAITEIGNEVMHTESRVYGGGLRKVEPSELSAVPLDEALTALLDSLRKRQQHP